MADLRGLCHVQSVDPGGCRDSEDTVTFDDVVKVLRFETTGRMVGGHEGSHDEVIDVLVQAAELPDLSLEERNELEHYAAAVVHQFHQQMRKLSDAMGTGGSSLKIT
jgi:hypothetical protein